MAEILWTAQAMEDLSSVPDRFAERLLAKIDLLGEFPLLGPAMDGPYDGFRQLLVHRYRVIYQVEGDEVRIAYIRHGARQLGLRLVQGDE